MNNGLSLGKNIFILDIGAIFALSLVYGGPGPKFQITFLVALSQCKHL